MTRDIGSVFEMGDLVDIYLEKPLTPLCVGSETRLTEQPGDSEPVTRIMGEYVGDRPGLIKVNPLNSRTLDAPRDISRYVAIKPSQIKEAYSYGKPKKVFP